MAAIFNFKMAVAQKRELSTVDGIAIVNLQCSFASDIVYPLSII